jgi:hypothetical protein
MQIAAFGAGKSIFRAEGSIENDKCRLDGGPNEIRTDGTVRRRFGLFGPEFALFHMKSTGEGNWRENSPAYMGRG